MSSSEDLADRLSANPEISTNKANFVGTKSLNLTNYGKWQLAEMSKQALSQHMVAQAYWAVKEEKDLSGLMGFLEYALQKDIKETFNESIKNNNFDLFLSLFKGLSMDQLGSIDWSENLNVLALSNQPVKITDAFLSDLSTYMRDINFSGVVKLFDGHAIHTVTVDKLNQPNAPFAIHSIGKMFTAVLLLRLIEEDMIPREALDKGLQLDHKASEKLPDAIKEGLSQTTLHKVLLHQGRFGNYLEKYQQALKKDSSLQVDEPIDFLAFADEELVIPDKNGFAYSNLGYILIGLAIEHLYEQKTGQALPYSKILYQYVIKPAKLDTFNVHKPPGARFNEDDQIAAHISGGPAGGYWTTPEDLLKFGIWLGDKAKTAVFMELLESYGASFYQERDIAHGGSLETASAHLSHRIDNELTVAVMSDMPGLGQASQLARIIHEHLFKQTQS